MSGANGGGGGYSSLFSSPGAGFQTAGGLFNIANGIRSGSPTGYAQAGIGAAGLANNAGQFGTHLDAKGQVVNGNTTVGAGLGVAGGALGIYQGFKQGGVQGYGNVAVGGLRAGAGMASLAGNSGLASSLGGAAGYAAAPLAVYSAISGYQSGDTAGDTLRGAEAGAAIGSIVPVVGTVIGGVIGGAVGALSSAFGSGKVAAENAPFNHYTEAFNKAPPAQQAQVAASVQNPYVPLAGYFDLRSGQLKGQNPIYTTYGRMGEKKFTNDLISKVQQGQQQGISNPNQMWSSVVQPWISSMGTWQDSNKNALMGLMQNMTGQVMSGSYKNNFKAIGGDNPFQG